MIEIDTSHVTLTFRSLFHTDEPQAKRCFAVLEGSTAGRMFTDDLVNPTWGVVQEGYDNCIYLGGTVDETTITGVRLPETEQTHYLIVIAKQQPTDDRYPRRVGMPAKRPL